MSETVIKKTVKRKTKSKKTPASLRREVIDELERMAMSDEENPRDKLKALELLARLTETNESPFEKPLVVRVEITDDEPEN
jgi:hypothetical protein